MELRFDVEASWNVMAHAQKPDFVFQRNGRVHLNRPEGRVSSVDYWHSRGVRISGSNAGYTMFRGNVKGTGYPLHSPVSPSLPLPCVTVCLYISAGLYHCRVCWSAVRDSNIRRDKVRSIASFTKKRRSTILYRDSVHPPPFVTTHDACFQLPVTW